MNAALQPARPILEEFRTWLADTGKPEVDWIDAPEAVRYVREGKDDLVMLLAEAVNDLGKREHTMLDRLLDALLTKGEDLPLREADELRNALRTAMTNRARHEINQRLGGEQ